MTSVRRMQISTTDRMAWRRPREALLQWRTRVEALGILVLETSRVKMSEMRGFSLAERAPYVIVVNGKDSERGKIFTLVHELAHLARRASGVCDLHSRGDVDTDAEVFCNAIAGRVLLPWSLLSSLDVLRGHERGDEWTDDDLEAVVRLAGGPSREVVLRRLPGHPTRLHLGQHRLVLRLPLAGVGRDVVVDVDRDDAPAELLGQLAAAGLLPLDPEAGSCAVLADPGVDRGGQACGSGPFVGLAITYRLRRAPAA